VLFRPAWRLAPSPPGLADRAGARLADVEPPGGVDPDDVEFEDRIVRHRLDHPAHPAAGDHRERRRPQPRVVPGFPGAGPDRQFVILGTGKGVDRAPRLAPQVVALGEDRGMAASSLPPASTGQNGCSLGLPSGRVVARNAIAKHGVPGAAGWPRSKAVMPGHSIAATAAISGAPDSNSRQVATMPLSRHSRHGKPDHRSGTINGRPVYADSRTALLREICPNRVVYPLRAFRSGRSLRRPEPCHGADRARSAAHDHAGMSVLALMAGRGRQGSGSGRGVCDSSTS
jgi:hypothetical protein